MISTKKVQTAPRSQVHLECSLAKLSDQYQSCTGPDIPSDGFEDICSIALTSSLSKIDDSGKVSVSAINISVNQITLNDHTGKAYFEILKEGQADNLIEADPQLISLAKKHNSDVFEVELNRLIQDFHLKKIDTPTARPTPDHSKLWFPTL